MTHPLKLSTILQYLTNDTFIKSYISTSRPTKGFFVAWDGHGLTHLALDFQDQYWQHSLWFSWGNKLSYSGIYADERTEIQCDPSDFSIINKHNMFCHTTWFAVADRIMRRAGLG